MFMSIRSDIRLTVYVVLLAITSTFSMHQFFFWYVYIYQISLIFFWQQEKKKDESEKQDKQLVTFFMAQEESRFQLLWSLLWSNIHIHVIWLIVKEQGCLPSENTFSVIQLSLWCNSKLDTIELCPWITVCVASVDILRHFTMLPLIQFEAIIKGPQIGFWGHFSKCP
jgi:hypothetical protein